jgi:hypothetical protein
LASLSRSSLPSSGQDLWTLTSALEVQGIHNENGSLFTKFPWFRGAPGRVLLSGRAIGGRGTFDGVARYAGYPPSGFVPSIPTFSRPGCWEITARLGSTRVRLRLFVQSVLHHEGRMKADWDF